MLLEIDPKRVEGVRRLERRSERLRSARVQEQRSRAALQSTAAETPSQRTRPKAGLTPGHGGDKPPSGPTTADPAAAIRAAG